MLEGSHAVVEESTASHPSIPPAGLLSREQLYEYARELATTAVVVEKPRFTTDLFERLGKKSAEIRATHSMLTTASPRPEVITGDAEWLLDNFYVIEEQLHEIEEDLPPKYFAELPKLNSGEPRVYQIATTLVDHTAGLLDEDTILSFVKTFQQVSPLTIGEVWAIPIMLRIALIEYLGQRSVEMRQTRAQREEVARILDGWNGSHTLPESLQPGCEHGLLVHAVMAVDECPADEVERLSIMERLLIERHPTLHEKVREFHQKQAARQISVGNSITAMRLLSALDWVAFFEQCSLVEQILRTDPSGTYPLMDYETRDRYRHVLERIARRSPATEIDVAQGAIALASQVQATESLQERQRHVGYWLIDDGRAVLEAQFHYRPSLRDRLVRGLKVNNLFSYLTLIFGISLALTAATAGYAPGWTLFLAIPAFIALSDFAVGMVNYLITRLVPPRVLAKLELRGGLTHEQRTIVVMPSMLTGVDEVHNLLERLELHHVANVDRQIAFALLTDFADADQETTVGDQALLDEAIAGIRRLNAKYGLDGVGPFYLFHRRRLWNAAEGRWIGWERKRGKLMEFNRLLRNEQNTSYFVQEGNLSRLIGPEAVPVKFVITCDADTQLPFGTARLMIGALAHPLNRPCYDAQGKVVAGYSMIQPRVGVSLADGQKSWYGRIMANSRGIDPYATAASDVYQDLFGEGSFTGKGIYDLAAFEHNLQGAFGKNQILSHDLIEGCHVRTALASDIELIDGFPMRYDADARRQHRWVRGDWQIAPWLLPSVPSEAGHRPNPLSWLSRWKIADNLRRSLVPPSICLTVILGWYLVPHLAWVWSLIGLLSISAPSLIAMVGSLEDLVRARDWSTGIRSALAQIRTAVLQLGVQILTLPHRAVFMVDAIVRTWWRMLISRRNMLEWQTAASADRFLGKQTWPCAKRLWYIPVAALVMAFTLPTPALWAASPWLVAWLIAPVVLELISHPRTIKTYEIDEPTRLWLRQVARKNWSYFEENLTPQNHWLPPDNVQEYPRLRVADRLSPTNEGLFLVSVVAARDFGYLGLQSMLNWWEKNLTSLCDLHKAGGHFFNWYDTITLEPLRPRYLSTVDSGNLAACLLVVRQSMADLQNSSILSPALWNGLYDTIVIAEEAMGQSAREANLPLKPMPADITTAVKVLRGLAEKPPQDLYDWPQAIALLKTCQQQFTTHLLPVIEGMGSGYLTGLSQPKLPGEQELRSLQRLVEAILDDYRQFYGWLEAVVQADLSPAGERPWQKLSGCQSAWTDLKNSLRRLHSLRQIRGLEEDIIPAVTTLRTMLSAASASDANLASAGRLWLAEFSGLVRAATRQAAETQNRFAAVAACVQELVDSMDFEPLYDPLRRLFSIGYNLDEGRLDGSHYDLLCSEARLSSYIAVAKGDVPVRHWFRLGRQTTYTAGQTGLLSWGGTMFEFLMPLIFQPRIEGSLLSAACEAAVAQQKQFGRQRGVPWGVSESAFASLSPNSDYQYQSFGVPGLGLKRGLSKDNVVAPYATMLALEIDPQGAIQNLRQFEREGILSHWGFYEAVDYTTSRVPAGRKSVPVRCFMAHHQGMSFLSLANLLNDEAIRNRFRAHPLMRAAELLLQEGVPVSSPMVMPHADEVADVRVVRMADQPVVSRRIGTYDTPTPRTHLLSNGSYAVMLTNAGSGYSCWKDTFVSRWRPDVTRDHWGQWLYISNPATAELWSATYQPTLARPDHYEVVFSIDKAEYHRRDGDLESQLEVAISPEDSVEVRHLRLTNTGPSAVTLEIASYMEVVLTKAAADQAHPAFQKLFVETEYIAESKTLLARRRPCSAGETILWAVHTFCPASATIEDFQYETSRVRFLGRGRTTKSPLAMDPGQSLSGTTGQVLDPIFSLRCRVTIPADSSVQVGFMTALAPSREEALRLATLYHDWRAVQRALELAWAYNQMELRHWRATAAQTHRFQRLASSVLYPNPQARGPHTALVDNRQSQSQLWPFGISGDRPIVLVRVNHTRQLSFVRELLIAQEYWAYRQLQVDLVLLNSVPGSYFDELQEQLERLIREMPQRADIRPRTAYAMRAAQLSHDQMQLLEAVASIVIDASRGWSIPILQSGTGNALLEAPPAPATMLPMADKRFARHLRESALIARGKQGSDIKERTAHLERENGYGGFADEGREYHVVSAAHHSTPMPWSNVIANDRFGCLVTESGGGYTWAANSRENKLTTWSNDPVSDTPSEQLYLKDAESGEIWPLFGGEAKAHGTLVAQHGAGWSRWIYSTTGWQASTTLSIATNDSIKFLVVEIENNSDVARTFSLTWYVEWVLGVSREETQMHVVSELEPQSQTLLVRNAYHAEYPDQVVFMRGLGSGSTVVADRTEFLGRNADLAHPAGLDAASLSGKVGPGLDPCGAAQTPFSVGARQSVALTFVLGRGATRAEAEELIRKYDSPITVSQGIESTRNHWETMLDAVQVETPNRSFDLLVNRWLVYQTLSCRIWGRAGFYQASGAYGFRDQLQDTMAIVYSRPDLMREHLLRAASRQYIEGDVQHWWHPPTGRGTRTRFSDDLLWLIVATCHYVDVTGDKSVWDEKATFLESPLLGPDEHERYEQPRVSSEKGTLYEHCLRALRHGFRLGPHGLPLMGCGDWNDGMNKVGEEGRGESVWVGWFLMVIIERFAPIMEQRGDKALASDYREKRDTLWKNIEWHAWDGEWYRRAFFDDGSPMGSHENEECQIDSIAQSWAVLARGDADRSARAMNSAIQRLVRPKDHLVALLTPPFDHSDPSPGYIMGYLKGVRENGGQYTHAVLWLIQALTEQGDGEQALAIFDLINPIRQAATPVDVQRYQVEPYVMAADVYSEPPHVGRGGWTWYTGSASWTYRVALENILGLQIRGKQIQFRPCVPQNWNHFQVSLSVGQSRWNFRVELHDEAPGEDVFSSNRQAATESTGTAPEQFGWETPTVELFDDGQVHHVTLHCRRRHAALKEWPSSATPRPQRAPSPPISTH